MFCYHRVLKVRRPSSIVHRLSSDDRGVAALEAILVILLFAGVLFGIVLLGQWGTHLQYSQLGARLLAFNASGDSLARFGRAGDSARQTFSRGSWDMYAGTLPVHWLDMMFVLPNDRFCGRVTGVQRGRQPGQGSSLFDFSPASIGYSSGSCAGSNAWTASEPTVNSDFLGIAYYVGRYQSSPQSLGSVPVIPPATPLLETIFGRVGGVR
jgi:hypothetical protein